MYKRIFVRVDGSQTFTKALSVAPAPPYAGAWKWARAFLLSVVVAGCGGDAWLHYPLSVSTALKLADVDGDGRPDILAMFAVSTSENEGHGELRVRRQTEPGVFGPVVRS